MTTVPPAGQQVRNDCREQLDGRSDLLARLRGETLVVTGGTGFVGTWLTEMVAALNDDFGFGCRVVLVARNPERFAAVRSHLAERKDLRLLRAEIRHLSELPSSTNWLIHAAASPDNRFHASSPVETMSAISEGTAAVLRALDLCADLRSMLFLSSGMVYGPQPMNLERIPETFPGAPSAATVSSGYAEAKRFGETLCAASRSQKKLPISIARLFAFLGPYQSLETPWAANNFLHDALAGNPIRIQGDGETIRSYMYGADLAFWLLRMLVQSEPGRCFNVGSPSPVTLRALAEKIASQFSPGPEVRLQTARQAPRSNFVPDTTAAGSALGLSIRVPLDAAIERTLRWNRDWRRTVATAQD